jgi:hypothetical protein
MALLAIGLLAVRANSVRASTIYQTGFESPTYSVGALNGQDGWGAPSQVTVQNTTVFAGAQAATFNATGVTGQSIAGHALSYDSVGNPEARVDVTGEFFLSPTGTGTNWDVVGLLGNAGFIGQLLVIGSSNVTLGLANTAVGNVAVSKGVWNQFDMVLDYSTDTQSAYVNGTFVGQGAFATASTTLGSYGFGVNSAPGTDTFSLDNLDITAAPAPLPSSAVMGLALLGGLAVVPVLGRRKAEQN